MDNIYKQYIPVQEVGITQNELRNYIPAQELLVNLSNRLDVQSNISRKKEKEIDILPVEELTKNIKESLRFRKDIETRLHNIQMIINTLNDIVQTVGGSYGLHLELHLPSIEKRFERLKGRIDKNFKLSNTHKHISEQKKEIIIEERFNIQNEMNKFHEDLREYL